MMDYEKLAYVPLDLPRIEFNYEELDQLMKEFGQEHYPYTDLWHALAFCGRISDFDNPRVCDDAWNRRYEAGGVVKQNPHVTEPLAEKFWQLIRALPYEDCTFAQILSQKKDVVAHQDGLYDVKSPVKVALAAGAVGFNLEPEPAGLKIMLSHLDYESFFVCERRGSRKIFIKIPQSTNSFAINERRFWHGAKAPPTSKYLLSTFGKIDPQKHRLLIDKSLQKYNDYAIWF